MASIPLPALDVKPMAPAPDPLAQYGKVMQLRNMMGEQQVQQQQLQSGAVDLQQKQQAQSDQHAMTTAMQNWDGKDINQLIPLTVKNGASATAVMGLKTQVLAQQEKYSKIAEQDANTGSKNMEVMKQKNDFVLGGINSALQAPDAELPQQLTQTVQNLSQSGVLDPQHAQTVMQLIQQGDPTKLRQGLSIFAKGYMSQSQLMQKVKDDADLAAKQAALPKAQAEGQQAQQSLIAQNMGVANGQADWTARKQFLAAKGIDVSQIPDQYSPQAAQAIQQMGQTPHEQATTPVERVELKDWLAKNPGKTASDFIPWRAQNSPMAIMSNGMLLTPEAQQMAAQMYAQTGQLPAGFSRSPQTTAGVINTAAKTPGTNIAYNKATYNADKGSLAGLQKNFDQVSAFENTAIKNLDQVAKTGANIPDLSARFANVPVRMISSQMIGTPQMAAFKTALLTAQTESAKVLNSANAGGVLSDSARHEAQEILDGNLPFPAMMASINQIKTDFGNRHISYQQQISDIKSRMSQGQQQTQQPSQQPSSGDNWFSQHGGVQH